MQRRKALATTLAAIAIVAACSGTHRHRIGVKTPVFEGFHEWAYDPPSTHVEFCMRTAPGSTAPCGCVRLLAEDGTELGRAPLSSGCLNHTTDGIAKTVEVTFVDCSKPDPCELTEAETGISADATVPGVVSSASYRMTRDFDTQVHYLPTLGGLGAHYTVAAGSELEARTMASDYQYGPQLAVPPAGVFIEHRYTVSPGLTHLTVSLTSHREREAFEATVDTDGDGSVDWTADLYGPAGGVEQVYIDAAGIWLVQLQIPLAAVAAGYVEVTGVDTPVGQAAAPFELSLLSE